MEYYSARDRTILRCLSENSRTSISELAKAVKCSRITATKIVSFLEKNLDIRYTLELNENALLATERHLLTVNFLKKPDAEFLEEFFRDEKYVQAVYLTEGSFDLLIYARTSDPVNYIKWETYFASELSDYRPLVRPSELVATHFGYFPLNNDFVKGIGGETKTDSTDKKMLMLLNQNSRISIIDIARRIGLQESTVRYRLFKLRQRGIIKKFTIAIQNPLERYPMVYFMNYRFGKGVADRMLIARRMYMKYDDEPVFINPFQVVAPISGSYRSFGFTLFDNKEDAYASVVQAHKRIFKEDAVKVTNAKVVKVLKGLYPFRDVSIRENYYPIDWR